MTEMENKITDAKKEEIIKALRVIQDVCNSQKDCVTCPLRKSHNCCSVSSNTPNKWRISGTNEIWRAIL